MAPHRRTARLFLGLLGTVAAACGPTKAGIQTDSAADVREGTEPDTDAAPPDLETPHGSGGISPTDAGSTGGTASGGNSGSTTDAAPIDRGGAIDQAVDQAVDTGSSSTGGASGGGAPMELVCDYQSSCLCPAGQDCRISCPAGGCMVQCGDGATCTIDCAGGGCMTMCGVGAACAPTCGPTGGCNTVCGNDARCDVACLGGGCMSDCTAPGAACTVNCEGEGCFTMCQDATSSCNVSCNAGCPVKCGDATDCNVTCRAAPESCQMI